MADGFLGRWAQRKADARQGKPLVEPELPAKTQIQPPEANISLPDPAQAVARPLASVEAAPEAPPPLTLQDAQALGQDSDFKPFIARGVDPAVRNAAMKKLFTDPHYNVMDRLDTYIDDYTQSDPLPLSMLRKMASAQFLKLVDEEPEKPAPALSTGDTQSPTTTQTPPTTPMRVPATDTTTRHEDHAHTDLRLQPDHAPGAREPGRGTE